MGFLQFVLQCESCEAAWPPHASSRRQDESFLLLNPGVDRILDPWEPYGYDRLVSALSDPPSRLNAQSCITYHMVCPGSGVPGVSCITYDPRPRHRRLQRSPHITKASATDLLDRGASCSVMLVLSALTRSARSRLQPLLRGTRSRSLGAPSLSPPLLSLPSLPLLSLPCACRFSVRRL